MGGQSRLRLLTGLHLLGLWALAGAHPLLDQLSRNPEFFVAHHASGAEIIGLLAAVLLAVPAILAALVWGAGLFGSRARSVTLGTAIGLLGSILAIQLVKQLGVTVSMVAVPASLAIGAAAAIAYLRVAVLRTFVSVLGMIAAAAVPSMFLLSADIRGLWWSQRVPMAAAAGVGAGSVERTPIVMIIFDEMPLVSVLDRDRQIDPTLYPNLAALVREGTWFRNATTVDDFTRWAMPAILTGNYPRLNAVPTRTHYPHTLFSLLDQTHRLEVFEAMTALAPQPSSGDSSVGAGFRIAAMADDVFVLFRHVVSPADVASRLPDLTAGWANFGPQATDTDDADSAIPAWRTRWKRGHYMDAVGLATSFIDGITSDDAQPTFYFLHTLVSHHPYNRLPTGQRNKTQTAVPSHWHGETDEWAVAQHYQRHLLQIGFVDTLVGRIRQRLRSAGLYDRTLIVITADHGVSFAPGGPPRNFRSHNAAEIMRVPLLFKWPQGIGGDLPHVSDVNAETIDIAPTVAGVLGIALPWRTDGASLLNPSHHRRTKRMFQDRGAKTWTFGPSDPDVTPALNRKLELFGESGNYYRAPRVRGFVDLIGRPVSSLHVVQSDTRVDVDYAWEYENVNPRAPAVPFDVSGRFSEPRPKTFVGVAVNGILQAVSRTWDTNPRTWLATPPLDAWRNGRNEIDVFVIERDADGPLLRQTRLDVVRPADLNLVSDVARLKWGVRQWGFYNEERRRDGRAFRWARPESQLEITTRARERPRTLHVDVYTVGAAAKPLKIEVNGCTVFDGRIHRSWSAALPLEPCLRTEAITIRFTTELTRSKRDKRKFGVAFSSVRVR